MTLTNIKASFCALLLSMPNLDQAIGTNDTALTMQAAVNEARSVVTDLGSGIDATEGGGASTASLLRLQEPRGRLDCQNGVRRPSLKAFDHVHSRILQWLAMECHESHSIGRSVSGRRSSCQCHVTARLQMCGVWDKPRVALTALLPTGVQLPLLTSGIESLELGQARRYQELSWTRPNMLEESPRRTKRGPHQAIARRKCKPKAPHPRLSQHKPLVQRVRSLACSPCIALPA
jgi:hypothetical protein